MNTLFFESALLVLREGFEALLMIAALGAYLVKAGEGRQLPSLYTGAGVGVLGSIVAAFVFSRFNNGVDSPLLAGGVQALAAALLFYVSGWLLVRQDPKQWQLFLKKQATRAMNGGTRLAFAGIAFFAVFREGAETVLFLSALTSQHADTAVDSGSGSVLAGAGVALVVLTCLFVAIERLAVRLPFRAIFLLTSAFLFLLGLDFIGSAIKEFQQTGLIATTESPLAAILGPDDELNLSWQAVGTQLAIIITSVAGYVALRRHKVQ